MRKTYLTQVIPQRQREEDLLAKVKLAASKKDRSSLTEASKLSDRLSTGWSSKGGGGAFAAERASSIKSVG